MALALDPSLLGLRVRGDVDGLTLYTDRYGNTVWYRKAPPEKPPSPGQQLQRARFRAAIQTWRELEQWQRDLYEQASLRLSLCMTGLNLWITISLRGGEPLWKSIEDNLHLNLPQPPFIRNQ